MDVTDVKTATDALLSGVSLNEVIERYLRTLRAHLMDLSNEAVEKGNMGRIFCISSILTQVDQRTAVIGEQQLLPQESFANQPSEPQGSADIMVEPMIEQIFLTLIDLNAAGSDGVMSDRLVRHQRADYIQACSQIVTGKGLGRGLNIWLMAANEMGIWCIDRKDPRSAITVLEEPYNIWYRNQGAEADCAQVAAISVNLLIEAYVEAGDCLNALAMIGNEISEYVERAAPRLVANSLALGMLCEEAAGNHSAAVSYMNKAHALDPNNALLVSRSMNVTTEQPVSTSPLLPSGTYGCMIPQMGLGGFTIQPLGTIEILPGGSYRTSLGPGGAGTYEIRGSTIIWKSGPLSSLQGLLQASSFDLMDGPKKLAGCRLSD